MKQIFDWMREQIDKYSYDTETCSGRYIDIIEEKDAVRLVNEAEDKWEAEKPRAFDADAVYRKMWRESEEVRGSTMIEVERANEIILEELAGGVE